MARKKIVFVIVEGPSDSDALAVILNRIYSSDTVHVHIVHGDITADIANDSSNIISSVADKIIDFARNNHFEQNKEKIFKEIIHIVDTDGAYIPDENIKENMTAKRFVYSLNDIKSCDVKAVKSRNERKRKNINKLHTTNKIWGIPYRVFYMSCNLDHVLYNKLNCTDEEKENNAFMFAKKYRDRIPEFLDFISKSDFSVNGEYLNSWEFIKKDLNSLKRYSNLGICFEDK